MNPAAGIGLRHPHMPELAVEGGDAPLRAPWLEIHSENFLCAGGPRLAMLDAIAKRYPISCHGVGLSLGSAEGLSHEHLRRLSALFARVKPALVSEHLSWSVTGGVYLNDLLPLPYTEDSLRVLTRNIGTAQDALGRQILVENPSAYLNFPASTMSETAFLRRLVKNTGCGLLLDVNNVYVSATNNAFAARTYLDEIPMEAVGEIHLAGHSIVPEDGGTVLVDTHSTHVCADVWNLYDGVIARMGPKPTLIEWDLDIPALPVLLAEAARAQAILERGAAARVA